MSTSSEAPVGAQKDSVMQVEVNKVGQAGAEAQEGQGDQATTTTPGVIPPGFIVHTESSTSILFAAPPSSSSSAGPAPVFLNPVQEYNRDLSVVAIRTWGEVRQREKRERWEEGVRRKWARKRAREAKGGEEKGAKKRKAQGDEGEPVTDATAGEGEVEQKSAPTASAEPQEEKLPPAPTYTFTLLEALSATGLRAIRYAKELPLLRYVVANDLSASAVADIRRNIAFNGLSPPGHSALPSVPPYVPLSSLTPGPPYGLSRSDIDTALNGKVRVNEGDACVFMYLHRDEEKRFDCVDLDPYGSAVPFLDAAVNATADGGLMCITCTDMGVLAGHNYPEKSYTHYGGVCVNAEYSHEVALRLVLNALSSTASRYGRYIEPQLSLSIDFYVRLFVRVRTGPKEVKAVPSKTALVYYCHSCQTPHFQHLGRFTEKVNTRNGQSNATYHVPSGPPEEIEKGGRCAECGGKMHIAGPMWAAPIHNRDFVKEMLEYVESHPSDFKTSDRIKGMLRVALSEVEAPLYFSPAKIASFFHAVCPPITTFASALLNANYTVSRSHAMAGSIKTNAPRSFVHDVVREWIKLHPVAMKNVKEGSPAKVLLAGEQRHAVSLAPHPNVSSVLLDNVKLVRYQTNPQENWGPAKAAVRGAPQK
ncbi:tRNA (guanine-N2-)-methyltransferase [Rhodotorula toruloides]|uniref:tRNA (guanine(26)-N(2))-dimethyltransferase n=1 Tax=Rhodotorula toruloides TaxID=5286 RepID=A0A511KLK7_RHOTO|nr:tRNA (guanine-N2-)-methyltransferase [Rhodotorula toruloides]